MKRITLNNFQAHLRVDVNLDPKITCITGRTDSGKSSIVRALRWVCLNDITGDEFIREGSTEACVEVRVKGSTVTRQRGRGNTYTLDEQVYKAFGTGVPDQIVNLLSVSEINFQSQHDAPFWFSESAGEVSRQLNSIIDLSIIDSSLAHVAARVRQEQERERLTKERLEEVKQRKADLTPQRQRVTEFRVLEGLRDRHLDLFQSTSKLSSGIERVRSVSAQIKRHQEQADEGKVLLRDARACLQEKLRQEELSGLIEDIERTQREAEAPPPIEPLNAAFTKWWQSKQQAVLLHDLVSRLERAEAQVGLCRKSSWKADKEFHDAVRGEACPLCGQIIEQ